MIVENLLYAYKIKKDKEIKENFEDSSSFGIGTIIFYIIGIFGFYMWYSFHFLVENPDRNFITILYPLFFTPLYFKMGHLILKAI